jgi:hypothetical protein
LVWRKDVGESEVPSGLSDKRTPRLDALSFSILRDEMKGEPGPNDTKGTSKFFEDIIRHFRTQIVKSAVIQRRNSGEEPWPKFKVSVRLAKFPEDAKDSKTRYNRSAKMKLDARGAGIETPRIVQAGSVIEDDE